MNEVVKYHNYMNSLKFTGFTTTDYNFLITLCSRMKNNGINNVTFDFTELRNLTNYKKSNSVKQFITDLKKMNEKLMRITCSLETETEIIMFVLFPTFAININNRTLTVSVNEKFKFILNELVKNFTRFDLQEFISLESKYSKTLYRLLKQYKTTGKYEITVDDFKEKMDCPESYNNKQFMQNIINPAVISLQNYFVNLKCEPQYAHKRGRPITGYIFTFEPEHRTSQTDFEQKHKNKTNKNGFANFDQRTYDFVELEKDLLNRSRLDDNLLNNDFNESQLKNMLEKMRK